jgi:hypothetical protein
MILLHCDCGTDSQVEDSFAGRAVRCPNCDKILHVPLPGQPGPTRFKGFTRKSIGIVFGLLLLATMAIPISGGPDTETRWLFDLISEAAEKFDTWFAWPIALFVGVWAIGLLLLVLGIALRKLPLALAYLILASAAVVLIVGQYHDDKGLQILRPVGADNWSFGSEVEGAEALLHPILGAQGEYKWLAVGLIGAFLAFTSLRRKMGGFVPVCLLQLLVAGGLLAACVVSLIHVAPAYSEVVSEARTALSDEVAQMEDQAAQGEDVTDRAREATFATIGFLVHLGRPVYLAAALGLAALLSTIHALTFSRKSRGLAGWALMLSWLTLILWWLMSPVIPPLLYAFGAADSLTPLLRNQLPQAGVILMIILAVAVVCVEAVSGLIADMAGALGARPRWIEQPAPQTAPPPKPQAPQRPAGRTGVYRPPAGDQAPKQLTPGQRLDRLKTLKDQGKISDDEYNSRREQILKEL